MVLTPNSSSYFLLQTLADIIIDVIWNKIRAKLSCCISLEMNFPFKNLWFSFTILKSQKVSCYNYFKSLLLPYKAKNSQPSATWRHLSHLALKQIPFEPPTCSRWIYHHLRYNVSWGFLCHRAQEPALTIPTTKSLYKYFLTKHLNEHQFKWYYMRISFWWRTI